MSAYNYVVSAQKPTNVTHAVMGNFTAPDAYNLIVAKCTRIEIHTLNEEGLQAAFDMPIFGRIATMAFWRPSSEKRDLLCAAPSMPCPCVRPSSHQSARRCSFISTERYQFCLLSYDQVSRSHSPTRPRVADGRTVDPQLS